MVLGAKNVPSLVIPETGRSRHDLHTAADVDDDELINGFHAQIECCISILGKAPDVTVFNQAQKQVCEEHGIVTGLSNHVDGAGEAPTYADAKWADRKIYFMDPGVIKCKRLLNQNTYKRATA